MRCFLVWKIDLHVLENQSTSFDKSGYSFRKIYVFILEQFLVLKIGMSVLENELIIWTLDYLLCKTSLRVLEASFLILETSYLQTLLFPTADI